MMHVFGKVTAGAIVSLAALTFASQAEAGWRWHGSSGGSSGSWGSSGGSWGGSSGSWGSHGGGWGGHWHHKRWGHHGSWGGSSGGSWGSWGGSSGSWGSSGGSYGGAYYSPGIEYGPAIEYQKGGSAVPMGTPPAGDELAPPRGTAPATETRVRRADGMLAVSVPDDAKIFVNGQATSSTGGQRQYVSRGLQSGYNYSYEVRAEAVRGGRTVEQVKKINLRAGETANLAFDFPAVESLETSLTVHVPAEAKVYLAGNPTKASGETRIFRTTGLTSGKAWESYTIRVELERGGRTLTKEESITVKAGESQELRFDFEGDQVASTAR
jgi:uncharacterized protein (TIGR03000 family)